MSLDGFRTQAQWIIGLRWLASVSGHGHVGFLAVGKSLPYGRLGRSGSAPRFPVGSDDRVENEHGFGGGRRGEGLRIGLAIFWFSHLVNF